MITHDHRGRPLSPAMSQLLSSTVIPTPPKQQQQQRKRQQLLDDSNGNNLTDGVKPIIESIPSSCSLSSTSSTNLSPPGPITPPGSADAAVVVYDDDEDDGHAQKPRTRASSHAGSTKSSTRIRYASSISSSNDSDNDDGLEDDEDDHLDIDTEDELFNWSWIDDFRNSQANSSHGQVAWTDDYDWSSDYSCSNRQRRKPSTRRLRELPFEECTTDHPLSAFESDEDGDDEDDEEEEDDGDEDDGKDEDEEEQKSAAKTFVNNLTASLKAVANSFSSQDKFYTNHLFAFSPRSTDEPIPPKKFVSRNDDQPQEQQHEQQEQQQQQQQQQEDAQEDQQLEQEERPRKRKSVNLKTYAVETTLIPHLRPREIRMNSSFYRVYAVETLMRKNGKLNAEFQGKATMILEPRNDMGVVRDEDDGEMFGIRKRFEDRRNECRWSVINASDLEQDEGDSNEEEQQVNVQGDEKDTSIGVADGDTSMPSSLGFASFSPELVTA